MVVEAQTLRVIGTTEAFRQLLGVQPEHLTGAFICTLLAPHERAEVIQQFTDFADCGRVPPARSYHLNRARR